METATAFRLLARKSLKLKREHQEPIPPLKRISPRVKIAACSGVEKISVPIAIRCDDSHAPSKDAPFLPKSIRDAKSDLELLADAKSKPTNASFVEVYELVRNAAFREMFKQLRKNPRKFCMTEHQIMEFVHHQSHWLKVNNGYSTFFLVALTTGKIAVVDIVYDSEVSEKLDIFTFHFLHGRAWNTTCKDGKPITRRLVILVPPRKRKQPKPERNEK